MDNQTHQLSDFDEDQMDDLRRGPWTLEEDFLLVNYITNHGEGRWNSLARSAGLKRTGKSCRLRWLNYLRPDVRRGNITLEEQLLILELHSRWGNRWSKIAQHLPGRTDNEIKNYWRTRVQKHAKQLQCDVNSKQFKDTMRYLWMPRLVERIQAASASAYSSDAATTTTNHNHHQNQNQNQYSNSIINSHGHLPPNTNTDYSAGSNWNQNFITTPENSSTAGSSDSMGTQFSSDYSYNFQTNTSSTLNLDNTQTTHNNNNISESLFSPYGYYNQGGGMELQGNNNVEQNSMWGGDHGGGEDISGNLWNDEDIWFLQQQLYDGI